MTASPIRPGDSVVLLGPTGRPVKAPGGLLRGRVLTVSRELVAVVQLARTGCLLTTSVHCLRRCPALAYCRPSLRFVPGAA